MYQELVNFGIFEAAYRSNPRPAIMPWKVSKPSVALHASPRGQQPERHNTTKHILQKRADTPGEIWVFDEVAGADIVERGLNPTPFEAEKLLSGQEDIAKERDVGCDEMKLRLRRYGSDVVKMYSVVRYVGRLTAIASLFISYL